MLIDFFCVESITESVRIDDVFGVIDLKPARTTTDSTEDWTATVANKNKATVQFTPIDDNKYFEYLNLKRKIGERCDGMLYYANAPKKAVVFIELKTGKNIRNWKPKAKKQLRATILLFCSSHNKDEYDRKEIYVCNGLHPVTKRPSQHEIDDFFDLGFDFFVNDKIVM